MHSILQKQNDPDQIKLLKAASAAYTRAKYFEVVFLRLMFGLAVFVPVIYLYFHTGGAKLFLGLAGFTITILIQLISVFVRTNVTRGALFKEKFDLQLFGLPWKTTISHPDPLEVDQFALNHKRHFLSDWYPKELNETLPAEICIAACQRINAEWDIWIRHSFCRFLYALMGVYSALLLSAIIYFNPTGLNILPMLFSSISFYIYFINQTRGHKSIIDTRKKISVMIDQFILLDHKIPDQRMLRDIQDEILNTRKQPILVPDFYYRFFHKQMQMAVTEYVGEINAAWSEDKSK